eukprot:555064-Pyramimonas_sp.AAC.1
MPTNGRKGGPATRTARTWAKDSERPLARLTRYTSFHSAMLSSSSSFDGRKRSRVPELRETEWAGRACDKPRRANS